MAYTVNSKAFKSIVNNGDLDPIQGFDVDVWAIDQGTGAYNLVGRFNSIQVLVKNSTENYLEFNQRMSRNLDGEIQIGWIMERGMLDARVLEQTFGVSNIDRAGRINRMPRLQITFSLDARELSEGKVVNSGGNSFAGNSKTGSSTTDNFSFGKRQVNHEMVLSFCKVDNLTIAAGAGKQVVANRWEGLAEGIQLVNRQNTDPGLAFETITAANALKIAREANVTPFADSDSVLQDVVERMNSARDFVPSPEFGVDNSGVINAGGGELTTPEPFTSFVVDDDNRDFYYGQLEATGNTIQGPLLANDVRLGENPFLVIKKD